VLVVVVLLLLLLLLLLAGLARLSSGSLGSRLAGLA
jgi:hypothetical protein